MRFLKHDLFHFTGFIFMDKLDKHCPLSWWKNKINTEIHYLINILKVNEFKQIANVTRDYQIYAKT